MASGQQINSTAQSGQRNIYNDAIRQYLNYRIKVDKIPIDTMFIEKNETISGSLQTTIKRTFLKSLDWTEVNTRLDQTDYLLLYKILPLSFDKKQFSISIIPYSTTKANNETSLSYGGECRIIYSFDNRTKSFLFVKVDCWGI
jgi:hypothetical protein